MSVVRPISDVIDVSRQHGNHFFDPETIAWFRSEIVDKVFGVFFVTSEQFDDESPRLFTIRRIDWDNGTISTVGKFQQYETLEEAMTEVKRLALDWLNFPEP